MDQFGLTLLLLLQVDLERELEHKEALLAHCMKKEAEEVWRALLLPSGWWSHASVQHPLATYLQKSSTSSRRGLALQSGCQCPNHGSRTPQSIRLTKALSSERSGLASCVEIQRDETARGAQESVEAGGCWLLASALTLVDG